MNEYKQMKFVVVSPREPTYSEIDFDKFEGEKPTIRHKGDLELLQRRWHSLKLMVDEYLEREMGA